jgi:hypothetical protein
VPRLSVPQLGEDTCEFVRAASLVVLTHEDLTELRRVLGGDLDDISSSSVRLGGQIGGQAGTESVVLRELVTAHTVSVDEAREEWQRYGQVDAAYPPADKIAAHVHVELRAEIATNVSEVSSNVPFLEGALEWLRSNKDLSFDVTAFRAFSTAEHETVVSLPAPPRPFTAVRALTLSKETDSPAPGTTVYEVHIQNAGDCLHSMVNFRTKLLQGADAFQKIVDSASEIAGFAVRKRVASTDQ